MIAKKGIGKTHAKWSPVSTCIMRKQPLVALDQEIINKKLSAAQKSEFVSKCPRQVFKFNEFKKEIEIENADQCSLCQECTKFSGELGLPNRAVSISEDDARFKFTVEGTGSLPPEEVVLRAIKILQRKVTDLSDGLANPRYINP